MLKRLHTWLKNTNQGLLALGITVSLLLNGCGIGFDSIAEIEGLRVLAVKKSKPYAKPGDRVDLKMLVDDDAKQERPLQILWISGCTNPPADLYSVCLEGFNAAFKGVDFPELPGPDVSDEEAAALLAQAFLGAAPMQGMPPAGLDLPDGVPADLANNVKLGFGFGEDFSITLADDIVSSRPPPPDPKLPPYGLEYVFFAACAGRLWPDSGNESFPLSCFDEQGKRTHADRYVVGYSAVYAYDKLTNSNPGVLGIELNKKGKWSALETEDLCIGDACETLAFDADRKCPDDLPEVKRCKDADKPDSCDKLKFRVSVDESSVDADSVLSAETGSNSKEQMWVNYHTDRGKFTFDLSLVNAAEVGFNDDPETEFIAPEESGRSYVWAVVRDNRGGADWARFSVCVKR